MSTRTYAYQIDAGATVVAPGGRFFYLKASNAAVNIHTRGTPASPVSFIGVGAGLKFGPVDADKTWRFLDITSAVAQVVEVVISDDAEVDIASTVNVAGSVNVTEVPASILTTPARIPTSTGADAVLVPANLTRRRVTIQNPPQNTDSVCIGAPGQIASNRGLELEPGDVATFTTTAAISARAVTNTPAVQVLEES